MMESFINPTYIRNLVDLEKYIHLGHSTESVYMDFKLDIDISSLSSKKRQENAEELALDICQFANTWGGVLLIGVKEREDETTKKKVAEKYTGVSNFEGLSRFINDSVLPLIHPRDIKLELVCIETKECIQIVTLNILPLADGMACVYNTSPPYSPKYPYRTHYGKKYFHPVEVERRTLMSNRSVPIKLNELINHTREVTLYPKIEREALNRVEKWDSLGTNTILKSVLDYAFVLNINGIDINIPFSLAKDIWLTEKQTIGILLNTKLIVSSDRKSINLDL